MTPKFIAVVSTDDYLKAYAIEVKNSSMNVLSPIKNRYRDQSDQASPRENSREKRNKLEPVSNRDVIPKIDRIFHD